MVSKETVVLAWWGSEILEFSVKEVVKKSNFHREGITNLTFRALAPRSDKGLLTLQMSASVSRYVGNSSLPVKGL